MDQQVDAKTIVKRMMKAANVRSQTKLADIFGITPPAISDAIINGRIPDRWFGLIEEKFNIGRDELCLPLTSVVSFPVQRWGNQAAGHASLTNSPMITGHHIGEVTVTVGDQNETLELSPREVQLILRMRRYAPPALWDKLEQELLEQEQKYG